MTGIEMIAAERKRQIEVEGWDADHDKQHVYGELAMAAACYAVPYSNVYVYIDGYKNLWPWGSEWYKPTTRLRDLVKSGALILAEIDRLLAEQKGG